MTLETLIESITNTLQEPDITEDDIISKINEGCKNISSTVLLPLLDSSSSIAVIGLITVIPTDWNYQRNLYAVHDGTRDIKVLNSEEHLRRVYPNYQADLTEGTPEYACISNGSLIIYPIAPGNFECKFYKLPTYTSTNLNAELSFIPHGFQESLIKNYCMWKFSESIEDGIEGSKINTSYYRNQYKTDLEDLENAITNGQNRSRPNSHNSWV